MSYEYSNTDCKFVNVCSFSPRCKAKNTNNCNFYEKDTRNFFEKIFLTNNEKLLREFKIKERKIYYEK